MPCFLIMPDTPVCLFVAKLTKNPNAIFTRALGCKIQDLKSLPMGGMY